jgi:membrane fusion protein (multidrug efflux system)
MFGDEVAILAGLTAGDHVAASGSFKLREGALVAITDDQVSDRETRQVSQH